MEEKTAEKRQNTQACIQRIREGDQAAFAQLLADYMPLVNAEVSRHGATLGDQDREDLRQIASVALYRAALGFDLEQCEVEFGLYAKICIANALASQLRVIRRRAFEVSAQQAWLENDSEEDPTRRVLEQEAAEALYAKIHALLSPYENRVWSLFVAGRSAREIAQMLHKEPHSVENAVYRIRQKLRAALGERGTRN